MKNLYPVILLGIMLSTSCQNKPAQVDTEIEQQVSDTLVSLVTGFLHCWEPPFYPEKALSLFTQTDDFYLVIDGLPIRTFSEWAKGVPNFMADDDYYFTSYKHEIAEIKPVVLSPESGVVTISYIWDSVSREGIHSRTDGSATLTCRKEADRWKIVHYHGSHGEEQVVDPV